MRGGGLGLPVKGGGLGLPVMGGWVGLSVRGVGDNSQSGVGQS